MAVSKEIAYLQQNSINHWGIANDYAEEKFPMVIGKSTIQDGEELNSHKESYEKGMLLLKLCQDSLKEIEQKVLVLSTENTLEKFKPTNE